MLVDYPAKGFCLKLSDFKNIEDFVTHTFLVMNYLQLRQMPHNVFITRAKSKSNDELYNDMRIYIWVRKPLIGVKDTTAFIPGVCELSGHLLITGKNRICIFVWNFSNYYMLYISDENIYNNLTEDDVINVLYNITEEYFLLIKNELKIILEK